MEDDSISARILRLQSGDYSFGCAGKHGGIGTVECPFVSHHHHDEFCSRPTLDELIRAGINPNKFKMRSRS